MSRNQFCVFGVLNFRGWKSRFYLMSRNFEISRSIFGLNLLEKPVLFDVTEHTYYRMIQFRIMLEKPVLFDVTELINSIGSFLSSGWKSRFYLMSRNRLFGLFSVMVMLEKPVLFDVTEHLTGILGQNFRWKSRFYLMSRNLNGPSTGMFLRWKSRFYLMSRNNLQHFHRAFYHLSWKSRFYLMSRNNGSRYRQYGKPVGKAGFI